MVLIELVNDLQAFMNMLMTCSWDIKGIKHDFEHAGLHGFAAMARNESRERYDLCRRVENCLKRNGFMPKLGDLSAPRQDFANVVEALDHIAQSDYQAIDYGKELAALASENKNAQISADVAEIINYLLDEHEEIKKIRTVAQPIMNDVIKLNELDAALYYKYTVNAVDAGCCCGNPHDTMRSCK